MSEGDISDGSKVKVVFGSGGGFGGGAGFGHGGSKGLAVGEDEVNKVEPINSAIPQSSQSSTPVGPNTSPPDCHFFLTAFCLKGDGCQFRHSTVARNYGICRFWLSGFCKDDAGCTFQHPSGGGRGHVRASAGVQFGGCGPGGNSFTNTGGSGTGSSSGHSHAWEKSCSKTPCLYFQQGQCTKGSACHFLHAKDNTVTDELPPIKSGVVDSEDDRHKLLAAPLTTGRVGENSNPPTTVTTQPVEEMHTAWGTRGGVLKSKDGQEKADKDVPDEGDAQVMNRVVDQEGSFAAMPFAPGPQLMIGPDGGAYIMGPQGPVPFVPAMGGMMGTGNASMGFPLSPTGIPPSGADPGLGIGPGMVQNFTAGGTVLQEGDRYIHHKQSGNQETVNIVPRLEKGETSMQHGQPGNGRVGNDRTSGGLQEQMESGSGSRSQITKAGNSRDDNLRQTTGLPEERNSGPNGRRTGTGGGIIVLPDGGFMTRKRATQQQLSSNTLAVPKVMKASNSLEEREWIRLRDLKDLADKRKAREVGRVRQPNDIGRIRVIRSGVSGMERRDIAKQSHEMEVVREKNGSMKRKPVNMGRTMDSRIGQGGGVGGQPGGSGEKRQRAKRHELGSATVGLSAENALSSIGGLMTGRSVRGEREVESNSLDFKVSSLCEIKSKKGQHEKYTFSVSSPSKISVDPNPVTTQVPPLKSVTVAEPEPGHLAKPTLDASDMDEFSEWL